MNLASLKEKIRKLVQKAESTTFEAEAASYMSKARQMMEEYQISVLDLRNEEEEIKTGATRDFQKNSPAQTRYRVEAAVAAYFSCYPVLIILSNNRCLYELNGSESALTTTELMAPFVWKQVLDKAKAASEGNERLRRRYVQKISLALICRMQALKTQEDRQPKTLGQNMLIQLPGAALELYMQNRYDNLEFRESKTSLVDSSTIELANSISLDRQVGAGAPQPLLLEG